MSDYSDSLDNKVSMCPCTTQDDIPIEPEEIKESSDENETVENGFEVLSGDSGSDEEQDTLAAQGYVPLAQSESDSSIPSGTEIEYVRTIATNETENTPEQCEAVKPQSSASGTSSAFSSISGPSMTKDEIDLIKSVMVNIKLPTSSIPEWAKRIPEEKWIAPFVSSLPHRNTVEPPEEKS